MGFKPEKYSASEADEIKKRVSDLDGTDAGYRPLAYEIAKKEDAQREKYKDKLSKEDVDDLGDDKSTDALEIAEGDKERQKSQERLTEAEQESLTDQLTGLENRKGLIKIASAILRVDKRRLPEGVEEKRSPVHSLILLDLDHFKKINDTYGHPVGDIVLKEVAEAMKRALRKEGSAYRFGGEEFAIFLPYTNSEEAKIAAERIRQDIKDLKIKTEGGQQIKITASLGFSDTTQITKGTPNSDFLKAMIENSDVALYQAKEDKLLNGDKIKGRDQVCKFVSTLEAEKSS